MGRLREVSAAAANKLGNALSAEFVISEWLPNGGTAVLVRSIIVTTYVYALGVALRSVLHEDSAALTFDLSRAYAEVRETLHWAGAIFVTVYAALYARFASQWHYLAGLYNQFMAAAMTLQDGDSSAERTLRMWQAGFIEDADELHLVTKPMFASVIEELLKKPEVREIFCTYTPGGAARLLHIEARVAKTLSGVREKWSTNVQTAPNTTSKSDNTPPGSQACQQPASG